MSKCILILGMHRSGTSSLAGSLKQAGLHLGEVLSDPVPGKNEKGLQEPASLIHLHEDLLGKSGGSWHEPPATITWKPLHHAVRDLFIESRKQRPLWGFKEPRTLLLLDGWITALEDWTAVATYRHPAEVALSMQNRNGFSIEKGLELWKKYNEELLKLHDLKPFPIVSFSSNSEQTSAQIAQVIEKMGLAPLKSEAFFNPKLRNFECSTNDNLPDEILDLYQELKRRESFNYSWS